MTLLFPETGKVCKEIRVLPIGHSRVASDEINTRFHYLTDSEAMSLLPGRSRFSYKNTFGHVAVVAGSKGKTGAALLCCKASLETGAGLVTLLSCDYCADKVQAAFPEAMCVFLDGNDFIKSVPEDCSAYKVLAIGPGLGTNPETSKVVLEIIRKFKGTMVVDADALNMISQDKNFYWPANAIITPHPGEFDRLTQQHTHAYDRFVSQMEYSIKHNIIVVLKSAYTSISLPDGRVYFNLTGTAAMAKAGSGDVLTGMIAAWLSQGLSPENAALLGVYLHGKSGELAEKLKGSYSVIAGDLVQNIHTSINSILHPPS